MADIRCPHCGKDNPDFFDVCQFCQAPLKPESMLHIGEEPTKKNTDELEEILPEWLKDARQKGKDQTADEALRSQVKPRVPKEEPPDLLAGLMSQADSEEEDVPDWLAGITGQAPSSPELSSAADLSPSDFFAQFDQTAASPESSGPAEGGQPAPKDELSEWFTPQSAEPAAPSAYEEAGGTSAGDMDWMKNLGSFEAEPEKPQENEREDLGWLRDLEASSRGTGELPSPGQDAPGFAPASSAEDLSWLDNLGGATAPPPEETAAQPTSEENELSWLDNLGGTPLPAFEQPAGTQPSSQEDLGWLKNFGGVPPETPDEPARAPSLSEEPDWLKNLGGVPAPSYEEPVTAPPSSTEDLDWLDKLGAASAPLEEAVTDQPVPSQEDLSWLNDLASAGGSEPSSRAFADTGELNSAQAPSATPKPFRTAPLHELLGDNEFRDTTPDWLKSAMEEPSMPAPGAVSMDWFSEHDKTAEPKPEETAASTSLEPVSPQPAFDFSRGDSAAPSQADVDALFMEMPDWLSSEAENVPPFQSETAAPEPPSSGDLAPVELPSWVQAMRPVDSAIGGTPATADQVTERQGPLAGFRGVIPLAPIGSALRPKAFSLKLQVTEEQQAGATLLEQILAAETTAQPLKSAEKVSSQRFLRWALSALFLIVLGAVLGLGLQTMPILAPASVNELSSLLAGIPENAPVLVVMDYEPSFSGELEAAAGPLLDQLVSSRRSTLTFVSMSPNGTALVERLLFNTNISKPAPDGLGYQAGAQYFNTGFLPGGSSGVLGFIENPADDFARYQAVVLLTDSPESGRVWVEQLEAVGQKRPEIAAKPLLLVSSAQAGPMLQPYVDSGQVDVMINGLADAAKYELVNVSRPGLARAYWDAFGYGLMLAVIAIVLGSAWSLFSRFREGRPHAEQG